MARRTVVSTAAPRRRGQRAESPAAVAISELTPLVDALIRENRDLKKQLARLEAAAAQPQAPAALRTLHRRLEQAMDGAGTRRAARPAPRRRVTDPVVLEKRREALAKARQALAEKRAASAASSD